MNPRRPDSRKSGRYVVAPNRFWSSVDGRRWRVWLELPSGLMASKYREATLVFVPMSGPSGGAHNEVRAVPIETVLEQLTGDDLEALLAAG